jgi:hypothetical protein
MRHSMLKVAAATAVFGLVHSALASRPAKRAAARTFGERNRNGLYYYSVTKLNACMVSDSANALFSRVFVIPVEVPSSLADPMNDLSRLV